MGHLFEGQVKKPRGRLSFFKRLSYQKGSPVAMWEDMLFCVKGQGQGMCAVTSPPYEDSRIAQGSDIQKEIAGIRTTERKYGGAEGQIGNLRDK